MHINEALHYIRNAVLQLAKARKPLAFWLLLALILGPESCTVDFT